MGCCNTKEEPVDFSAEVNLAHFELLRLLGRGAYGKVKLVKHKNSKTLYALKYINKQQCITQKAVDYIIQERNFMEEIHSTFVCNLRYSFQDDENMFMVIDLKHGGDLRFALTRSGKFSEESCKFLMAEVLLGILYLHSKKVVHRDLKPENILLDEQGHACLTDFNVATYFKESKLLHAIAGSLSYMAPEILDKEKKGYNQVIDFWSMGIIMFEMLYGKVATIQRPFRGKTDEELEQAIQFQDPIFPTEIPVSERAIDFMKRFLARPYTDRLGSQETGGDTKIMSHEWFSGYDWDKLEKLEGKPVYVPDSKSLNVDETVEIEELYYADNPLKAKPRKVKDGKHTSRLSLQNPKQSEKMETQFKLFDHTKMGAKPKERKRSKEWDAKMSQIASQNPKHSASSIDSHISDLRETRSQYIYFEPDAMTVKSTRSSRRSSRSDVTSIADGNDGSNAANGGNAAKAIPGEMIPAFPETLLGRLEEVKQSQASMGGGIGNGHDTRSLPGLAGSGSDSHPTLPSPLAVRPKSLMTAPRPNSMMMVTSSSNAYGFAGGGGTGSQPILPSPLAAKLDIVSTETSSPKAIDAEAEVKSVAVADIGETNKIVDNNSKN